MHFHHLIFGGTPVNLPDQLADQSFWLHDKLVHFRVIRNGCGLKIEMLVCECLVTNKQRGEAMLHGLRLVCVNGVGYFVCMTNGSHMGLILNGFQHLPLPHVVL